MPNTLKNFLQRRAAVVRRLKTEAAGVGVNLLPRELL